jgi:hypothetical protein
MGRNDLSHTVEALDALVAGSYPCWDRECSELITWAPGVRGPARTFCSAYCRLRTWKRFQHLSALGADVDAALARETDAIARRLLERTRARLKLLIQVWSPPPR